MSLTSFLTQDPMQYAPTMGQTNTALPQWYNDYTQGILQNAAQWANQGYQAYPGPQVAGLSPDQQASYQTVQGTQGLGQGYAQQGAAMAAGTMGTPNALSASQPYMNAASQPISSQMGQFMNPYLNGVVANANTIANRQFNEQVLPGLQNQFTQAGQVYGGSNQGVFANQLARNLNLNEQMSNQAGLASGFNTALQGAQGQAGIYSGLAGTAGANANAMQNTGLSGANLYGQLGSLAQSNALTQAGAQNQMGQQQQANTQANYNTAYQNFLNQVNYPLTAAQGMGSALSGIQVPQGQTSYNYSPYGYGLSPLAQGISTYGGINSMMSPPQQQQPMNIYLGSGSGYNPYGGLARGGQPRRPLLGLKARLPSAYRPKVAA